MAELRLPKLPDRTPVKLSITVSPELHRSLGDYAAAYEQAYGQALDALFRTAIDAQSPA